MCVKSELAPVPTHFAPEVQFVSQIVKLILSVNIPEALKGSQHASPVEPLPLKWTLSNVSPCVPPNLARITFVEAFAGSSSKVMSFSLQPTTFWKLTLVTVWSKIGPEPLVRSIIAPPLGGAPLPP